MRIQHNIPALNAYRNYTNNTSNVSKNLEKLSSGYRINRAGDDAAGLAISEKMRAQITGLQTAQKNAKDGISLIQTGEGALTEVHSMLNRMVELANQSANGTYDDDVDRANLQKEIASLTSEIDRIADGTNYNGINLLDGSKSSTGGSGTAGVPVIKGLTMTPTPATAKESKLTPTAITGTMTDGQTITYKLTDDSGKVTSIDFTLDASDTTKKTLISSDGTKYTLATASKPDAKELGAALAAEIGKTALGDKVAVAANAGTGELTFTSKTLGSAGVNITALTGPNAALTGTANTAATISANTGTDAFDSATIAFDKEFSVGGKKFMIASTADKAAAAAKDVNVIVGTAGGITNNDVKEIAAVIQQQTGYKPTAATAGAVLDFKAPTGSTAVAGGGLTLQIGDSSASFNQLKVSIGDMHAKALGIQGLDISTQDGAAAATDLIKAAINTVSGTRGDMGALQNRLEHTINNLSVAEENITSAEAAIRDVDVAKEMMAYTKNNILVQSAQAMLAQANQLPQGVLQLLQ